LGWCDKMDVLILNDPIPLQNLIISKALRALVLAPHPDDLDTIGVTARLLLEGGNPLYVMVATRSANGVEDSFCSPPTPEVKARIREDEQRASCQFLGLPEAHLSFLRLEEDEAGHPVTNQENIDSLRQHILSRRPDLVFLPHGHDTNLGHQRVYVMFHQVARGAGYPLVAFLNRDPKTIQMRCDTYLGFDETSAVWKAKLLRFHQSQHQRNLNRRGYGFDERILGMNRHSAKVCSAGSPYAEVFELEYHGASGFEDLLGL
jgi:LmbE family N-acetylglucosaminyl deacetylase